MNKKYIAAIAVILGVSSASQIYGAELVHRYSFPANSVWSPDGYYILEDSVGDADGRTYGSAYCSDIYDEFGNVMGSGLCLDGKGNTRSFTEGSFAALPANLISEYASYSVETWITGYGTNNWQRVFDFGSCGINEDGTIGDGKEYHTLIWRNNDGNMRADQRCEGVSDGQIGAGAALPVNEERTSASWSVWRPWWKEHWVWHSGSEEGTGRWEDEGWWEFELNSYSAGLTASMAVTPDEKAPTASGKTLKSGYGFQERVETHVSTTQSSAVIPAQNAVSYFPEFGYERYWRLLEQMSTGYDMAHEFQENGYSTYNRRTHFTPIWYPDGSYTVYTRLLDCWTPAGMLSMNLTDSLMIDGNLWSDWHIAPQNPDS